MRFYHFLPLLALVFTWIGDAVRVNLSQLDGVHAIGTFSRRLFRNEKIKTLSQGKFNVIY